MNRLVTFAVCFLAASSAFAAEAERAIWRSTSQGDRSVFRKEPSGEWMELKPNGEAHRFAESPGTTDEFVELLDPPRAIRIRLFDGRSELKQGEREFQWLAGDWTAAEELPDWAYLAPIDHKTRLVYFVPKDREPTRAWREKIVTLMAFVNEFFKDDFRRRGWNDRGLVFETDEKGEPVVHLVRGDRTAAEYNGAPGYDVYAHLDRYLAELPRQVGDPNRQLVVSFIETYDDGDARFEWPGGLALGGQRSPDGGMATFSAWILRDEFNATSMEEQLKLLQDATPIEGRIAHGHGQRNSPRFEFIEDGFGAVIHEVGHALGLPHDQRKDHLYVMGNGYRNLRQNLDQSLPFDRRVRFSDENASLLKQSRHLNPDWDREDVSPPQAKLTLTPAADDAVTAKLEVSDDRALSAYLYFDQIRGSVTDGGKLEGIEATPSLDLRLQADDKTGERKVEAFVIDESGRITRVSETLPKAE